MNSTLFRGDPDTLKALFNCLFESVSEEGFWKDFDESWAPVITTISSELLITAGIKIHDKWYIHRDQYKPVSLYKCIQYLNNQIQEDGSFGSDLWDTLRLGKFIAANELKVYFTNYNHLHNYIIKSLQKDDFIAGTSEWRGPGFYACAVDYLDLVNISDLSETILKKLLYTQERDGCWIGIKSKEGIPLVSPVWHTTQSIITLRRKDASKYKVQIERAIAWLLEKQEDDGSWPALRQFEIYFTAYAVLALSGLPYKEEISKATQYLKSNIDNNGKCSDLGGTLMCAIAFWETSKEQLNYSISFMDYLLSSNNSLITNLLEQRVKVLTNELQVKDDRIQEYENKYKDAEIILTKKQVFLIGIISLFITVLGTVVGVYGLKLAIDAIQKPQQIEQKQPEQTTNEVPTDNTSSKQAIREKEKKDEPKK